MLKMKFKWMLLSIMLVLALSTSAFASPTPFYRFVHGLGVFIDAAMGWLHATTWIFI